MKILSFILLLTSFLSAHITDTQKAMVFSNTEHNIGDIGIKDSEKVVFHFTNSSTKPFVILEAKTSCGCTVAKYSRRPILSGAADSVVVKFNPNETGVFYKKIVIKNSEGESQTLVIRGSVE
ncbi:MAG: DUF1573 domain-containing protein [Rikenellaceae bacterium]